VLPGWRLRRWRRRRATSALLVLLVLVLAFAVCARRIEVPRAVMDETVVVVVA